MYTGERKNTYAVARRQQDGIDLYLALQEFRRKIKPGTELRVRIGYDDDLYYNKGLTGCLPRPGSWKAVVLEVYRYTLLLQVGSRKISTDYTKLYFSVHGLGRKLD